MRRALAPRLLLCAVAVGLVALAACSSDVATTSTATSSTAATGTDARQAHWDLVVRADASWVGEPDDEHLDSARPLRLAGVEPDVHVFTDRPARAQGTMTVEETLTLWHGGAFGTDPPNAAIVTEDGVRAVELTAAVWDPTVEALVFAVRLLDPIDGASGPDLPTGELGPVSLFVDAVAVSSQVTDAITQTNVKVVAEAPAQAMGLVYQTLAHSVGLSTEDDGPPPSQLQGLYTPDPMGDGSTPPPDSGMTDAEWNALIGS